MTSNWFESSFYSPPFFCASNFQKCQVKNYKEDVVMNWNLYPLQEVDYAYRIAETFSLVVGWGEEKKVRRIKSIVSTARDCGSAGRLD